MRALLLLIACALFAAGCGYKGPLYLPGSKPERKPRAESQKPAPAAPEKEEDRQ